MQAKRLVAIALIVGLAIWGCDDSKPPQPHPVGLAAVISIDTVTAEFGTVDVPLRLTYTPEGRQLLDTLGEFRFLITFDDAVIQSTGGMARGEAISEWGYFSYNSVRIPADDASGERGVWITARRRGDNGRSQGLPEGILTTLRFWIPSDFELAGTTIDIRFAANGCTDNTMCPERDLRVYYNADTSYGYATADAAPSWMNCAPSLDLRPALGFRNGAIQVEEVDDTSLVAIITAGSVTVQPGSAFDLPITMSYPKYANHAPERFGGFNLLVLSDGDALAVTDVVKGEALSSWEYFTWRAGVFGCRDCPCCLTRIVGIRDMNNGINPDPPQYSPQGVIANIQFSASDSPAVIGGSFDVGFFTVDCGDNSVSDLPGNILYLADPDDPRGDPRAVAPNRESCLIAKPDHFVKEMVGFRSGKVTISGP